MAYAYKNGYDNMVSKSIAKKSKASFMMISPV